MKRFLVLLLLLAIAVAGLGFYLGWFSVWTDQTGPRTNVHFSVDQDKIRQDEQKAMDQFRGAGQKVKESTGSESEKE